jgi:hypothetical protein
LPNCATAPRRHARLEHYSLRLLHCRVSLALPSRPNAMLLHVRAISWNMTAQRPFTLRHALQPTRMSIRMQKLIAAAALAVGLGFMALPATAAPAGSLAGDFRTAAPSTSLAEQVERRCWWHRGERRCSKHRRHYREHGYGPSINLNLGGDRDGRGHRRGGHEHRHNR